jgi:hypothetical protein
LKLEQNCGYDELPEGSKNKVREVYGEDVAFKKVMQTHYDDPTIPYGTKWCRAVSTVYNKGQKAVVIWDKTANQYLANQYLVIPLETGNALILDERLAGVKNRNVVHFVIKAEDADLTVTVFDARTMVGFTNEKTPVERVRQALKLQPKSLNRCFSQGVTEMVENTLGSNATFEPGFFSRGAGRNPPDHKMFEEFIAEAHRLAERTDPTTGKLISHPISDLVHSTIDCNASCNQHESMIRTVNGTTHKKRWILHGCQAVRSFHANHRHHAPRKTGEISKSS